MRLGLKLVVLVLCSVVLAACQDAEVQIPLEPVGLGVTSSEVVFGSSMALQGHAGYLGQETLRGAMSYINHVNEQGGVHGRSIRIITRDDSYDPPKCLDNTQRFFIEDKVFGLFCYVGTPTTVKILPLVEEAGVPLLGMFKDSVLNCAADCVGNLDCADLNDDDAIGGCMENCGLIID